MAKFTIGIVGLGRMGSGIAQRLLSAGHEVLGYDVDLNIRTQAVKQGVCAVESIESLAEHARIIFLLIPAGELVDTVIATLRPKLHKGSIIIDAGNSNYIDSVRRHAALHEMGVVFMDCGTSGGLQGKDNGYCLMVGGDKNTFTALKPVWSAIAMEYGYAYMGGSGAGHYVKMVHNGIEYALLQAYAEGFELLKKGSFKDQPLDIAAIANVWNHGSVIRSWILELMHTTFITHGNEFDEISGEIADSGTGRWAVEDAQKHHIPLDVIKKSLDIRLASQQDGGNYATKIVALLRNTFGGHAFKIIKE